MSARGQVLQPWAGCYCRRLVSILLTVLFGVPVRIFGFGLPEPVFPLVLAFAWAVIRPSVLAPLLLLIVGLFLDLFWGGPLGLWPLCLLLVYASVLVARSLILGQDRAVMTAWYVAGVLLAFFTAYLIAAVRSHVAPNLFGVGLQIAVTAALFPIGQWLIERFEDTDVRFR